MKQDTFAMNYPSPYIIEPVDGNAHTHTCILLHGRSSIAKDFADDIFSLSTSQPATTLPRRYPTWRWVFPDAGLRWCSAFSEKRSAWFDTLSLDDLTDKQDLQIEGLRDGVRLIGGIIEDEVARLCGKAERVILGGFSQGSAVALWSYFVGTATAHGSLGALIGLSAWMPFTNEAQRAVEAQQVVEATTSPAERVAILRKSFAGTLRMEPATTPEAIQASLRVPVFLGHCTDDSVVNVTHCRKISSILSAVQVMVQMREYIGAERNGHWIKAPEEVDDLTKFLDHVLGEESAVVSQTPADAAMRAV